MSTSPKCEYLITGCTPDPLPKVEPPLFLIRYATGEHMWPQTNVYASFEEDCRTYNVIGKEGLLSSGVINENLEYVLQRRADSHDQNSFQLGQVMFEKHRYKEAYHYFRLSIVKDDDPRAKYQLGVMLFDNLLDKADRIIYLNPQRTAIEIMEGLLSLDIRPGASLGNEELVHAAAFNLFQAYQQGWGVYPSEEEALRYLLIAAEPGTTKTSISAQTTLGYYYSSVEHFDLKKAFYWHTEACGNGSVESQAVIGVMYMLGLFVPADWCSALFCLKEAAKRGSIFGRGMLSWLYYQRKMFTNAAQLGSELALDTRLQSDLMRIRDLTTFPRRGISIGCFIYARCLAVGFGVSKDEKVSRSMYDRSFEIDPELCSRFQNMVIRDEL